MEDPRLIRYLELLLARNEVVNLTAAKSLEELTMRHLKDSLELLQLPEVLEARTALDLGTGGGLPGVPLAVALPELQVTLLDATRKKVMAVHEFITELEVFNAKAVWGRAEELAHTPGWRQAFDLVVARAVAPLAELLEYAAPFCRSGGHIVAFKGPDAEDELKAAAPVMAPLHVRFIRAHRYAMQAQQFTLLVFTVSGTVPVKYPRLGGQVRKRPLGGSGRSGR